MKKLRMGADVTGPEGRQITLPERVCEDMARAHPEFFRFVERTRLSPERAGLPGKWAPWCFVPINACAGMLQYIHRKEQGPDESEVVLARETRLAAACAGWRMTKSVYVFDEAVLKALVDSEAKDGVPDDLFLRLPDWTPYFVTPGVKLLDGAAMHGFFVSVDDHNYASSKAFPPELCFSVLIDPKRSSDDGLLLTAMLDPGTLGEMLGAGVPRERAAMLAYLREQKEYIHTTFQVDLGLGSFKSGLNETHMRGAAATMPWMEKGVGLDAEKNLSARGAGFVTQMRILRGIQGERAMDEILESRSMAETAAEISETLLRLASIALYLCSEEPDVEPKGFNKSRQAAMDEERRTKRALAAKKVRSWGVGFRIGAEIKRWEDRQDREGDAVEGAGQRVRPHVRRAHWHTFRSGPRNDPAGQVRRVRWLWPIAVNVEEAEDLVPTAKPVHERGWA